jgi:hypothetical protein
MKEFAPKPLPYITHHPSNFYAFLKRHKIMAFIYPKRITEATLFKINRITVRMSAGENRVGRVWIYYGILWCCACFMAFQFKPGENAYTWIELIFNH